MKAYIVEHYNGIYEETERKGFSTKTEAIAEATRLKAIMDDDEDDDEAEEKIERICLLTYTVAVTADNMLRILGDMGGFATNTKTERFE